MISVRLKFLRIYVLLIPHTATGTIHHQIQFTNPGVEVYLTNLLLVVEGTNGSDDWLGFNILVQGEIFELFLFHRFEHPLIIKGSKVKSWVLSQGETFDGPGAY